MDKLDIDGSLMSLEAWHVRNKDLAPLNPPEGAFATRTASGGVPPYLYQSNDYEAVNIDGATGRVISRGNRKATITVTDSKGNTAQYPLIASNVHLIFGTGVFSTYSQCKIAAIEQGGLIPTLKEWRSYRQNYYGLELLDELCWTSDAGDTGKRWAINPKSGEEKQLIDIDIGGHTAIGFGIKPA